MKSFLLIWFVSVASLALIVVGAWAVGAFFSWLIAYSVLLAVVVAVIVLLGVSSALTALMPGTRPPL